MQAKLIEIIPDAAEEAPEESWTDWATRNVKENGWKAAGVAVVAAPIIPAGVGAVAVGAGLVSGIQHGVAWWRGSDEIEKLEISKASALRDSQGQVVQVNMVYALHPDDNRSKLAIVASDFHNVVVGEQVADLVTFIRSSVRATVIRIEVESERSGHVGGGFLSKFSTKAEAGAIKHHSVDLQYEEPQLIEMGREPFWLHLFPEIVAAFQAAGRGTIKRKLSVDTTFGLSSSVAEQAGIDASWLGKQRFDVHAEFV